LIEIECFRISLNSDGCPIVELIDFKIDYWCILWLTCSLFNRPPLIPSINWCILWPTGPYSIARPLSPFLTLSPPFLFFHPISSFNLQYIWYSRPNESSISWMLQCVLL